MVRKGLLLTVAAISTFVAGCSGGVEGSATADRAAADDPFDPCSIPDDVISAAGLDPVSESSMAENGTAVPGWNVCTWAISLEPSWYLLTITATSLITIDDVRKNKHYSDLTETTLDGQAAVQYKFDVVDTPETCDLAYQSSRGVIKISARVNTSAETRSNMCQIVRSHAEALSESLPQP